mgnify:FL=1
MTDQGDEQDLQSDAIAFLADPATYGESVDSVGRIDTHAAIVFLAGDDVYKIKRAVRFPFLDFTTLEKRRRACEREVEVNRLTAPNLYLGAVPITRSAEGKLAFTGRGPVVEWAVHMRRFDETATLDRLAGEGALSPGLLDALARRIVDLHDKAPAIDTDDPAGEIGSVALESCAEMEGAPDLFSPEKLADLTARTKSALNRHGKLIAARGNAGGIRRCHGDLHLGNVALIDGEPVIFDAIEFDEDLATIDVLYDLAFLIMDLWERGYRLEANRVLNRWLVARNNRDDLGGLALLPLFLSMRAAIRAKVAAARARHLDGGKREAAENEARDMFAAACAFLAPAPARLVAIGGLSGTGKTTVAMALAPDIGPAPGAVVVRSDIVRKVLSGVAETKRLPDDAYTPQASERVYAEMEAEAAQVLAAGHGAVLDAVHSKPQKRDAARAVAEGAGVAFTGIWLQTSPDHLMERVEARTGDASDATAEVVRKQLAYQTGDIDWTVVDTGGSREDAVRRARAALPPPGDAKTK